MTFTAAHKDPQIVRRIPSATVGAGEFFQRSCFVHVTAPSVSVLEAGEPPFFIKGNDDVGADALSSWTDRRSRTPVDSCSRGSLLCLCERLRPVCPRTEKRCCRHHLYGRDCKGSAWRGGRCASNKRGASPCLSVENGHSGLTSLSRPPTGCLCRVLHLRRPHGRARVPTCSTNNCDNARIDDGGGGGPSLVRR